MNSLDQVLEHFIVASQMPTSSRPRRRWYQISLRTLLLLVTLASAGFGWLGYKVRQANSQRKAVEAIRNIGNTAYVFYDYDFDSGGMILPPPTLPPGPEWLRKLVGDDLFTDVVAVKFPYKTTDVALVHLAGLSQLKHLDLRWTQVTDTGLASLNGLPQLATLDLRGTQVTDAGLPELVRLKELRYLYLDGTKTTDVACDDLKKSLPNLAIYQ